MFGLSRRRALTTLTAASGAIVTRVQAQPVPMVQVPYYSTNQPPLGYKPFQVRSSDGTIIAAQEWGNPDGPEIVFIHGVLQSHLSFERQVVGELAKRFRMITYDLRGHGDSEKPMEPERYLDGALWADDLAAVMAAARLRRPVLVGWSLGGLPMGNYLQRHGDAALAGLNFVDALTKRAPEFAGLPQNRPLLPLTASPDLSTRIDAMRGFLRACFKTQPDQSAFERMVAFNAQVPRYVMAHILVGIPLDAEAAYRRLRVPVLVTHGAEDGQISPRITDYDKSVMPGAKVSIYEGSGHSPFYEMADRFNAELSQFVSMANG